MRFTDVVIERAVRVVSGLDLNGKERLCDEIYREQPNLLASVLVLKNFGVSLVKMDFAFEMLLICYQAIKETGEPWPVVSESLQETQLTRITARMRFTEGLDQRLTHAAIQQTLDAHPEKLLFAYGCDAVNRWLSRVEAEETDKMLVLCVLNLIECLAHAPLETQ